VRALLPLGVCAGLLAASPAAARELYWKSLEVGATLDGQGVLHVVERQHMVFTGDWNGGERRFDLRPGQEVELRRMTRIDPETGARREMREGSLDDLDRYAWFSDRVLRWRSRLPGDPPFVRTEIVYDVAYSLYGALVKTGGRYVLSHDFAFADRPGDIEDVVVTLRIDPAWRVDGPREQTFRGGRLRPGSGYVVRTELEWSGAGEPAPVRRRQLESQQAWALTVTEHIALALANLRLRETLRAQAVRDSLTGLYNRRYMEQALEREILRAARNGRTVGVIMLDLDHFKNFNDSHGHEAGDQLLRVLGDYLLTHVRAEDIACRYGGEEFLVILPEASPAMSRSRAEELWKGVQGLHVNFHGELLRGTTASFGVAVFPGHGTTMAELLRAADTAMYAAKRQGRDRVETAGQK